MKDAEKVVELSNEERLDLLLVQHLPSDDEWEVNLDFTTIKFGTSGLEHNLYQEIFSFWIFLHHFFSKKKVTVEN